MLLAALIAVPLGVLIGLPALRLRGVNLAVVTLAAAFAIDALLFNDESFSGGLRGRDIPSPTIFGLDLGIAKGDAYPRVIFGVFVLVVVCLVGLLVARLRNAPAGRMFIAVRSNERAASAVGINVARTKLLAFGLSAFIAGLGGGLFAYQQQTISPPSFARLHVAEPAGGDLRRGRRADRRRGRGGRDAVEHRPAGHRARQGVQHRQVPARRGRRAADADRDQAARRHRREPAAAARQARELAGPATVVAAPACGAGAPSAAVEHRP